MSFGSHYIGKRTFGSGVSSLTVWTRIARTIGTWVRKIRIKN